MPTIVRAVANLVKTVFGADVNLVGSRSVYAHEFGPVERVAQCPLDFAFPGARERPDPREEAGARAITWTLSRFFYEDDAGGAA
jgi:hypothetical protein